jgi:hypothetical protein
VGCRKQTDWKVERVGACRDLKVNAIRIVELDSSGSGYGKFLCCQQAN